MPYNVPTDPINSRGIYPCIAILFNQDISSVEKIA